jgi:hypothetical protein
MKKLSIKLLAGLVLQCDYMQDLRAGNSTHKTLVADA